MGLCAGLAWSSMLFVIVRFLRSAHCIRSIAAAKGVVPCRAVVIVVITSRPRTSTGAAAASEPKLLAELVRHRRLVRAGVAGRGASPAAPAASAAAPERAAAAPPAAAAAQHRVLRAFLSVRVRLAASAALALPSAASG